MLFIIISVLSIAIYLLVKKQYSHWETAGVPHAKPRFPFGNLHSIATKERSFGTAVYDLYKSSTEPFLGIYLYFRTSILIRDAELVKNVLTKDFDHFHDRGIYCEPKLDPMSAHLFALPGDAWKSLKARLTPAFTSLKLKGMFPIILQVGDELVKLLEPMAEEQKKVDVRDLATRYVIDCLASIAFGQKGVSSLREPNNEFRLHGIKFNDNTHVLDTVIRSAIFVCPGLLKILPIRWFPSYMRKFCVRIVKKTIDERETNNIVRKDLMQYLIQLRNNSDSKTDTDEWKINASRTTKKSMTYEEIASNVFIFYIAGSESSSSTIAYTMYELTQNEELMEQVQNEIESTLDEYQGELTYESIMNMKLIDLCIKETLRKYPSLPILNRICTIDYQIPGTSFTIKKGTSVVISLLGLHRDAQYFPDPEKYDPFRFADDTKAYDKDMYMPFGIGPRNCIAFRLGLVLAKTGIVKLLMKYNFEGKFKKELEFDHGTVGLLPKPGECAFKISKKQ